MIPYVPDHTAEKLFSFCKTGTFVQLKHIFKMQKRWIFKTRQVGYTMNGKIFFKRPLSHEAKYSHGSMDKVARVSRIYRSY